MRRGGEERDEDLRTQTDKTPTGITELMARKPTCRVLLTSDLSDINRSLNETHEQRRTGTRNFEKNRRQT